jgi:tRNA nucleotidyltransferase (CCA-adding enzyme)
MADQMVENNSDEHGRAGDNHGQAGGTSSGDSAFSVEFVIPEYVQTVARILLKEGYACYLVGGALRDVVLDIEPDDYDLATDALPEAMLDIFPRSVSTGIRFGTVTVIVRDSDGVRHEVQVTTLRSEQQYTDGRWPSKVEFVTDLDEDLSRRDFTWNAMALDFSSALLDGRNVAKSWGIYDPFGGKRDLELKVVRAVGDPVERFTEDGLRAFKACRMAAQLGFEIHPETFGAIQNTLPVARKISMERIRDEFMKMMKHAPKPSIGIELMRKSGLLEIFMPELLETYKVEQPKFHTYDVYEHLLRTVDAAPPDIRLAALFHDIGKPRKAMPDGHFYGHDIEAEKMTRTIMKRMKFSRSDIEHTAKLVRHHMFYYPVLEDDASDMEVEQYEAKRWTDAAVRRFIARVGEENIDDLFALRIADAAANPAASFQPEEIELLQERISEVRKKDMALKVNDLAIDGHDLMAVGVDAGPEMGRILDALLKEVIEDPKLNEKDTLLKMAGEMKEKGEK